MRKARTPFVRPGIPALRRLAMINVNPFGGGNPFLPNSVTNPFSPTVWR
jgi:hypothetical protein